MPRYFFVALCCLVSVLVAGSRVASGQTTPPTQAVRHVVIFKYTPEATAAQIQVITDAFRALTTTIPGIVAFEHGVNNSPERLNQGFTHVYMLTFKDAAARDAYLPHPEHKKFGELLGKSGIFVGAFVVDYAPNLSQPVATTTPSGLVIAQVTPGAGAAARPGQYVTIHETTSFADGRVHFTTDGRAPIRFLLGGKQVIDGLDEGVTGMLVGERRRLVVPPALSRRSNYPAGLSPGDVLHYDVTLVAIEPGR
jgi:Stress responsive A/B Barrel Domain/FKBP-type peptidyl-prolyl cis-trans isomerase